MNENSFFVSFVNKEERRASFEPCEMFTCIRSCKRFRNSAQTHEVSDSWLVFHVTAYKPGLQFYDWTETSLPRKIPQSKDACITCFSAKAKDLGILPGLFFVYFCLFGNYSDSREHYKTPRLFSLTMRCLMQTLRQSFLTICVTFLKSNKQEKPMCK